MTEADSSRSLYLRSSAPGIRYEVADETYAVLCVRLAYVHREFTDANEFKKIAETLEGG